MSGLLPILIACAVPSVGPPAPPRDGFRVAAETRSFVFYVRDASLVEPARSQRFLDELSKRLGLELADRRAYYRYAWAEEVGFPLGSAASGASGAYLTNGDIHSSRAFDAHEIVHRVAHRLGNPGAMFHEGLAVELGDGGRYGDEPIDEVARRLAGRVAFRTFADRFQSLAPELRYPLAGSFVRFLVKAHGLPRLVQFFRGVGRRPETRDPQFAEIMGRTLDEAGTDWLLTLGC